MVDFLKVIEHGLMVFGINCSYYDQRRHYAHLPHTKTTEVVTTPFSAWTPRKEAQGPPTLKAPRSPAQMGKLFFRSFLV